MKKLLFIFAFLCVFMSCDIPYENNQNSILLLNSKLINNVNEFSVLQDLPDFHKQESVTLNNYSPYYNILRIFICSIIIMLVLVIVSTPLLLVYFWIDNFFEVRKSRTPIKKCDASLQLLEVEDSAWSTYKNSYSAMYGNTFGIIAWVFFTYFYVSIYYNDFNTGIIDYFRFPLKIMESLSDNNLTLNNHIPPKMWISMLFIVGISVAHYFLGRYIGSYISANFHKKNFFKQ